MIVGTALLGIFALASMSLTESTQMAASIDEMAIQEPELRAINATDDGVTIHVNITNIGDENIDYEHMWFTIDGGEPFQASQHHTSTSLLFPGEIQHIQISGTGLVSPSRIFVSALGATSAVIIA
tara:strand:+ start:195 stop:569 length:375 start_codon:yes stop_codon:yes gene_type:complete